MTRGKGSPILEFIPNNLFSLKGQNALVIGVGGLGIVGAMGLAAAGAALAVADFDADRANEVSRRIHDGGGRAPAASPPRERVSR